MHLITAIDEVSELSRPWTEVGSWGDRVEDARPIPIAAVVRQIVSAPVDADTLLLQGEENHNGGNYDSGRECGASDVVVLRPPIDESVLDVVVEEPSNGDGGPNVRQVNTNQPNGATEQKDWGMEVLQNPPLLAKEVERNREEGASEETPQDTVVDSISTEHLLWPKGTPQDRTGEESVNTEAGEVVLLRRCANIGDLRHLIVEGGRADES